MQSNRSPQDDKTDVISIVNFVLGVFVIFLLNYLISGYLFR